MGGHQNTIMTVIGVVFVTLGVGLWVVEPDARPVATATILFFGAVTLIGVLEGPGKRLRAATRARVMGVISVIMGLGCGAMGLVAWQDPTTFNRAPQGVAITVGVVGVLFFGLGGLLLVVRGNRPLGRRR